MSSEGVGYYNVTFNSTTTVSPANVGIKDWNAEFQEIVDGLRTTPHTEEDYELFQLHQHELFDKLSILASDFSYVTLEALVSHNDKENRKTIKPVPIGGLAGGDKYITQGILFKFATDVHGMYGSDEYAMKAASHDLKALMSYYKSQIPGLHYPLMCLIDFRGYRLVAMSLLPLKQLLYGSKDGGVTIFNQDNKLNDVVLAAAKELNIKSHVVGTPGVVMHSAADIEGHMGTDGRYYLLDFARTFPPEATSKSQQRCAVMYNRLRPEFVRKYSVPLSSDAYSGFGKDQSIEHDKEVKEATKYLKKVVIPEFSKWLETQIKSSEITNIRSSVSSWMHREGINVRHLGIIRSHINIDTQPSDSSSVSSSSLSVSSSSLSTPSRVSGSSVSSTSLSPSTSRTFSLPRSPSSNSHIKFSVARLLLEEMIARVIKASLRNRLRCRMGSVQLSSEKPCKWEVLEFFNLVLGRKEESKEYWTQTIKKDILRKYPKALSQTEMSDDYDLMCEVDIYYVLKRVMRTTGIRISEKAMSQLKLNPKTFEFVYPDLKRIGARVKDMDIVAHAEGTALYLQSFKTNGNEGDRLFNLAMSRFEAALSSTPDNQSMLNNWGDALHQQGLRKSGEDRAKLFLECVEKYKACKNYEALLNLAKTLHNQTRKEAGKDREQLFSLSHDAFVLVHDYLEKDQKQNDKHWRLLMDWGNMIWERAITKVGDAHKVLIELAGSKCINVTKLEQILCDTTIDIAAVSIQYRLWLEYNKIGDRASTSPRYREFTTFFVEYFKDIQQLSTGDVALLVQLSKSDPTFHVVDSSACEGYLSDTALQFICRRIAVQKLALLGSRKITVQALVERVPTLTHLDIRECPLLNVPHTTSFTTLLSANFPELRELLMGNNMLLSYPLPNSTHHSNPTAKPSSPRTAPLKLCTIDLQHCKALPAVVIVDLCRRCPNLTLLDASGCTQLGTDNVKTILSHCPKLQDININRCKNIEDTVFADKQLMISNLIGLKMGSCGKITRMQLVAGVITRSPLLQSLKLSACKLVNDALVVVVARNCPNLEVLDISDCNVTNASLLELSDKCRNLTSLGLNKCQQITDEAIVRIGQRCTKLQTLKLGGLYKLGVEGLTTIAHNCSMLTSLDIHDGDRLESQTIAVLALNCSKLMSLNLQSCSKITDVAVVNLSKYCTSLTTINLAKCPHIHQESVVNLAQNCPNLTEIDLGAAIGLGKNFVETLSTCRNLRIVNLRHCKDVTDKGLISLSNGCPMLEVLDLESCCKLSDHAVINIARYLGGSLRVLKLAGCYKLTDVSIIRIAQESPNMHTLKLGICYRLTDASILKIAICCPNISVLLLNGCKLLTDMSMLQLAMHSHRLAKLSVESCPNISKNALNELRSKCPNVLLIANDFK